MCWEVFVLDRNEYFEIVAAQIRCKRAVPYLKEELENHIQDQKDAYMAEGMNPFEAEMAAVKEMGDPVETGVQLDRVHRPKMEWKILAGAMMLGLIGFALQVSIVVGVGNVNVLYEVGKQARLFLVGAILMLAVCYVDYTFLMKHTRKIWAFFMILLFAMCVLDISFLYRVVNGVNRYVAVVVYFSIPIYAAFVCSYRGKGKRGLFISVLNLFAFLMILMTEVSLGFIFLIGIVDIIVLVRAINKNWFGIEKSESKKMIRFGIGIVAGMCLITVLVWMLNKYSLGYTGFITVPDYYRMRIESYLSGNNIDYVAEQIKTFFYDGSNRSDMPLLIGYMKSDYVWLTVVKLWGKAAGYFLGILYIIFIAVIFWKIYKHKNQFGQFLSFSCVLFLLMDILFYIGGNFGVTPFMGSMFLPFLGDGRVAVIVTYFYMGIILSVFRNTNVVRN